MTSSDTMADVRMSSSGIEGTCLCGDVRIAAPRVPREVTQCNCSVCRRYGTLWAYYARSTVTITAPRGRLVAYHARPSARLQFLHCKKCGCLIAWEHRKREAGERVGLNARLFDHQAIATVSIEVLDGDKTWKTLERYTKPGLFISPTPPARPRKRKPKSSRVNRS
jgi:hypothetical protein